MKFKIGDKIIAIKDLDIITNVISLKKEKY